MSKIQWTNETWNPVRGCSKVSEGWVPILDFPGYEVSADGLVRSHRMGQPRILRPQAVTSGYMKVSLRRDGRTHQCLVHRLVAQVFLGPSGGLWVNHINGVKTDNRTENLEWVTPGANTKHAYKEGLQPSRVGAGNGKAKLTKAAVLEIRAQRKAGMPILEIASAHGVSKTAVIEVIHRRTWAHV